jgi:glycosyltransferase involved in cell wall biosynthesis
MIEPEHKKRIKLMFLVGSLGTGGAERFVANALEMLPRDRFELSVALYRSDYAYGIPQEVLVTVLEKYKPWDNIRASMKFAHWINQIKPDVLISAWSIPNVFAAETLRWTRHKPVWIARIANDPTREESGVYGWWAKRSYLKASHFISVSSELTKVFIKRYPFVKGRVSTVHNAVDCGVLEARSKGEVEFPKEMREAIQGGLPIILSIGRLEPQKRFDLLLRAYARLDTNVKLLLVILGEGSLRNDLEKLALDLGIEDSVLMPGFVLNPYAWIVKATIFVSCSDYEGMSNALLEAQALGVPAVATDCFFGNAEIIVNGVTGILIETGNEDQLVEELNELIGSDGRRNKMGRSARVNVQQNHTSDNQMKSICQLIDAVLV